MTPTPSTLGQSLALLEITGLTPAMVALDRLDKAADVRLLQMELNDYYGVVLKVIGSPAALREAVDVAGRVAKQMGAELISAVIDRPDPQAWKALETPREFSPLIQAEVVFYPHPIQTINTDRAAHAGASSKEPVVSESAPYAIGLIETQGFTAVLQAIDTACKAANVQVVGKEKLGGGYVTVVIKGDVAAVTAAVDAGKARVNELGKLIAAHVIARPSEAVLSLMPR